MRKVIRVRLMPKPGKPVIFDQPTLPRHRKLLSVKTDTLGNLVLFYNMRADDTDTELSHHKLVEVDEIYDDLRYSPVHVFSEGEIAPPGSHPGAPHRMWVLLENNHPNLGP